MTPDGPDMDEVERLVADPAVKGMWCVPVYSNPDAITYSEETCKRLAAMKTAPDFRLMWDNAYSLHHLDPEKIQERVPSMLALCAEAGHPERPFCFQSTSKIRFAGGGIAALAASEANLAWFNKILSMQTICFDKLNQLRHVRFLQNLDRIKDIMVQHAAILRPKFAIVDEVLTAAFGESGLCRWTKPNGGYFVALYVQPGTAKRVVQLAADCGVKLTPAGSAYPYGNDPDDSHIRLAPSFPSKKDIRDAMEVLVACVRLAALEKEQATL